MVARQLRRLSPSIAILVVGVAFVALMMALLLVFSARQAQASEASPAPPAQGRTPVCGDGDCDKKAGEDCKSCPKDCGKCKDDDDDDKEKAVCGDEKVEGREQCDGTGQDECQENYVCQNCTCVEGFCGDWVHQPGLGEECDGGWGCADGYVCTEDCTCAPEGGECVPQTCKPGEYFDTGQCACLPSGECVPQTCKSGEVFNEKLCECVPACQPKECEEGEKFDLNLCECVSACEPKECEEGEKFDMERCECVPPNACEPDSGENEQARQAADEQDPNGAQPPSFAFLGTPGSQGGTTNFDPSSLDTGQSESKDCDGDDGERCDCWEIGAHILNTWGGVVTHVPLLCCDEDGQCSEVGDGDGDDDDGRDYYDGNTPLTHRDENASTVGYLASFAPQTAAQCEPVDCEEGFYFDTGQCACLPNGGGCEVVSCKPGEYFDKRQCECVPTDDCQPVDCEEDYYFDTGQCACLPTGDRCVPVDCPADQYFDKRLCQCQPGDNCVPTTCDPGEYFDRKLCKCQPEGFRLCVCGPGWDFCRPRTGDPCLPTTTLQIPNGEPILTQVYTGNGQTPTTGAASASVGVLASFAPQDTACEPEDCEEGFYFDTGQCACLPLQEDCQPVDCEPGEKFDRKLCECVPSEDGCVPVTCPPDQYFDKRQCQCVPYDQCEPQTCKEDEYFDQRKCTCVPRVDEPPLTGYVCDEPSRLCIDLAEPQLFLTSLRQNAIVQDYDAMVLWDCHEVRDPTVTTAVVSRTECEQKPLEVEGNGSRACADCEGEFCAFGPGRGECILVSHDQMPNAASFDWQGEYAMVEGQGSQVDTSEVWALICPKPPVGHICIPIDETMRAAYEAGHVVLADCFSGDPDDDEQCPVLSQEFQLEQDEFGLLYLCFDAGAETGFMPNCGPEPGDPVDGCAFNSQEGGGVAAGGSLIGRLFPGGLPGVFGIGTEGGTPLWLLLLFVVLALLGLVLLVVVILAMLRRRAQG